MRDKVGGITLLSSFSPEPVFKRRQRAHPAGNFDKCSPDNSRYMNPDEAAPSRGQKPAQDREYNKSNVNQDNQIGKQLIGYLQRVHCTGRNKPNIIQQVEARKQPQR